jgi:DNA polymerase-3 subunit alpha
VNKTGDVRFALSGMKGFGANVVDEIIKQREQGGPFTDIYNFAERMAGVINRKSFEALVYSGALESFGIERTRYFLPGNSGKEFIDELVDYGINSKKGEEENAFSLFGEIEELKMVKPEPPALIADEDQLLLLQKEKELVGMYLSSHPLDKYRFEMENFVSCPISALADKIQECEEKKSPQKVTTAGYITSYTALTTKVGKPYSRTIIEDYNGSYELSLFGKDHEAFMGYMQVHTPVLIEGEIAEKWRVKPEDAAQGKTSPYALKIKHIGTKRCGIYIIHICHTIAPEIIPHFIQITPIRLNCILACMLYVMQVRNIRFNHLFHYLPLKKPLRKDNLILSANSYPSVYMLQYNYKLT